MNSLLKITKCTKKIYSYFRRNIKRIVFTTVEKFNGKKFSFVSIPQLKQIAGRAGRFGTAYNEGEVTT